MSDSEITLPDDIEAALPSMGKETMRGIAKYLFEFFVEDALEAKEDIRNNDIDKLDIIAKYIHSKLEAFENFRNFSETISKKDQDGKIKSFITDKINNDWSPKELNDYMGLTADILDISDFASIPDDQSKARKDVKISYAVSLCFQMLEFANKEKELESINLSYRDISSQLSPFLESIIQCFYELKASDSHNELLDGRLSRSKGGAKGKSQLVKGFIDWVFDLPKNHTFTFNVQAARYYRDNVIKDRDVQNSTTEETCKMMARKLSKYCAENSIVNPILK